MTSQDPEEKNRRILLVDDNRAIHADYRKTISSVSESPAADNLDELEHDLFGAPTRALKLPRYQVDSAYQGREALEMVKTAQRSGQPYAMAFVDMRMPPGWDGLETIRHLWMVCPDLQVVVCTAYSDFSWQELVSSVGLTDSLLFLRKPFDSVEVRQLALAMTEKWNLAHQLERRLARIDSAIKSQTKTLSRPDSDMSAVRAQLAETRETIGRVLSSVRKRRNTE